jgi:hypothetical protein
MVDTMRSINVKQIATVALILFVLVSAGYLIMRNMGNTAASPGTNDTQSATQGPAHKVIVYYFYGNARCDTCIKIETYTQEALKSGFPDALNDGRIEWRPVNADEPTNAHFIRDYNLSFRSVVISDVKDGKQVGWKNLDKVWDLTGDKQGFIEYIQGNVKPYLEAA